MKTVLVCGVQAPFITGGAEILVSELRANLERRGFRADVVNVPFKWYPVSELVRQALAWRLLDLTESNFPIVTESYLVMWELVKQGLGVGILDGTIGDAEPRVRRVLPDLAPLMFPIWLVAHRELGTSRRVRAVFDLLAEELAT